jgi:hypothetical protein
MVDGQDCKSEMLAMLRAQIDSAERLITHFDPNGQTADGSVEVGEVPHREWGQMLAGRWVSYEFDERGRAMSLRFYEAEPMARADSRQRGGQHGKVAEDNSSIDPAPWQTAYALIQEMPNGWWKALVSGWPDLIEQIEPTEDAVITVIGAVARERLRERVARGMPTLPSYPAEVPGWKCVPVSIDL